jgi:hypothetical protein
MNEMMPKIEVREMKRGSEAYVLLTWPDGFEQHVNGFASESEARAWVEHESTDWLARHAKTK